MTIAIKVVTTKIELNAFRTTSFEFFEKKTAPFYLSSWYSKKQYTSLSSSFFSRCNYEFIINCAETTVQFWFRTSETIECLYLVTSNEVGLEPTNCATLCVSLKKSPPSNRFFLKVAPFHMRLKQPESCFSKLTKKAINWKRSKHQWS